MEAGIKYTFEKAEHVKNLYECMRFFAATSYTKEMKVGEFSFYNYQSYYLEFNGKGS
jgi:hypothetical protein